MLSLREPSAEDVARVLAEASDRPFSYEPQGLTRDGEPPVRGFDLDRYETTLGAGRSAFDAARRAVERWEMFRQGWAEIHPAGAPVEAGTVVAMRARAWGLWTVSPCRVVYTLDEEAGEGARRTRRFGFAYGTLPGHVERGEERFLVEWRQDTGDVRFEILAVSRPAHPLVRLAYPLARRAQRRFGRGALERMRRAVAGA